MVKKSNNPLSLDHEYVYTIISIIILLNVFKLVLFFIIICSNITWKFPKNGNDVIYSPSSSSKPEHKGRYSEECGKPSSSGALLTSIVFISTMEVNGAPKVCFQNIFLLCSAEQRYSYRFGTTWGWVNGDSVLIFGWTIPLINEYH